MSELDDISAIERTKYRYLRALDTRDWDLFASMLVDDIAAEYGASVGESHRFTDRDSLVTFMRKSLPADVLSEHRVTHPEITLTGPDTATGIWYLHDRVIVPKFDFMLIGAAFYDDEYRRTPDGWKISATGYRRTYEATLKLSGEGGITVSRGDALLV